MTIQFRRLFWHISCYKARQSNFITKCDRLLFQSASGITKCDRLLLQNASGITKCDRLYCKERQVLQSVRLLLQNASGITKCDRLYYKERQVLQSGTVITKWDVTWFLKNLVLQKKYYFHICNYHLKVYRMTMQCLFSLALKRSLSSNVIDRSAVLL